uniref:S5 DRBM domain-containing protein n=1 Tax=Triticum urartu TaxID=4572 RepID=A0A8R7PKK3_TRIUA
MRLLDEFWVVRSSAWKSWAVGSGAGTIGMNSYLSFMPPRVISVPRQGHSRHFAFRGYKRGHACGETLAASLPHSRVAAGLFPPSRLAPANPSRRSPLAILPVHGCHARPRTNPPPRRGGASAGAALPRRLRPSLLLNGHVGLGVKCAKEAATAIRGAIILAKLSIVPVRRATGGTRTASPIPSHRQYAWNRQQSGGISGGGRIWPAAQVPAPWGSEIVAARVPQKVLQFAGIDDVFTSSRGSTRFYRSSPSLFGSKEIVYCLF